MTHSWPAHLSAGANLRRPCCPNSYSPGITKRSRLCVTISILVFGIFRIQMDAQKDVGKNAVFVPFKKKVFYFL